MQRILIVFLLWASFVDANPSISQARDLLVKHPAEVVRLYYSAQPELTSAPAWLQRDWHLLATRAFLQLRQWPQAHAALVAADQHLLQGMNAVEIAMLAGAIAYQQQQLNQAWYWFRCAEVFDAPPETSARLILNLGVIAARHQQDALAKKYYQQGLAMVESYKLELLLPMYYNNLGLWYWRQGEFANAEQLFRKALYQHSRHSGTEAQARVMLNLLFVQASAKHWDKFNRYYREAAQLIKKQPNPDFDTVLSLLLALQDVSSQTNDQSREQVIALAQQIKGISLQQSTQLLLARHHIRWQASTETSSSEPLLNLTNTRAQCPNVSP